MGNKGRKSSRMYVTAKEWSAEWGGAKVQAEGKDVAFTRLRWDHCSISFQPMTDPVCAPDGTCFERENILQFIDKYGTHPRSGEPLKATDLFDLKYHKNADGEDSCPVTMKVFNEHTHMVAIRQTGRVYSFDAVNEMNIKFKNFKDLIDDTPFTKKDIVCIQDPHNIEKYNASNYHHVKNDLRLVDAPDSDEEEVSHIQASGATQRVLQRLQAKDSAAQQAAKAQKAEQKKALAAVFSAYGAEDDPKAEAEGPKADADGPAQPEPEPPAAAAAAPSAPAAAPAPADKNAPKKIAYKPEQAPEDRKVLYTTLPQGPQFVAASFTTTAATPLRKNRQVQLSAEELRLRVYDHVRLHSPKAYIRLHTSVGEINMELFPHAAPMTCENFITHCSRGYYNNTLFHRSIKNFMIQGGDPRGDGTGGESIWGEPFEDEVYDKRLTHEGRGVVAMANSGPKTNGSQFYMTYKSCKHLDGKHTIFGKVVGGLETLIKMERLKTDDGDRPLEPVRLHKTEVFADPYVAAEEAVQAQLRKERGEVDEAEQERSRLAQEEFDTKANWFSNPLSGFTTPTAHKSGPGKYIKTDSGSVLDNPPKRRKAAPVEEDPTPAPAPAPAPKKPMGKFDFSSW